MRISIKTNADQLSKAIDDKFKKQIPFATAVAINATARQVQNAERENMVNVLDRPRPFTLSGVTVKKTASKASQTAVIDVKPITASYLEPYEIGGLNKLNSRALLKPVDIQLDEYGNLPKRTLAKLKARKDIFIGEVKGVKGVWQKPYRRPKNQKRGQSRRKGKIDKLTNTTGKLKLLIKFSDAHPIANKNRLHWGDLAGKTVSKVYPVEFSKAITKALATAK